MSLCSPSFPIGMQAEVEVKDRAELRGGEDLGGGAGLENGAFEQDHFVGVLLQGGEIVGGEEDGHGSPSL